MKSLTTFLTVLGMLQSIPASAASIADIRSQFVQPPDDSRIMMRWWWFGTAVDKPELEREMRKMKEGGIGGVEIQPVYPVALDDPATGFKNHPYLSDEFIDALRFTSTKARELGLRVDVTLCSGWPYGGPHIPVTQAAGKLRIERVKIESGMHTVAMPSIGAGEKFIAAFLGKNQIPSTIENGRLRIPDDHIGQDAVTFFISSRTGQQVKRAALNSEGYVLDHYDRSAIENHLKTVGNRLMEAFGSNPPYAVFSDSLEVFASDWTPDLPDQFKKRRGYDLIPYLPALIDNIGPKTSDVRHDWGKTLTELAEERYLTPVNEWAHQHGTKFRSQTYGVPPVTLSSNALVDLPEGEHGPLWRTFSVARWAASASHLYNRPVTSAETWTWLHSPSFRATPLDMKAEADLHFLQGVNQLIGHGWPYSPEAAGEPGWRFYASAVFNHHNPWWPVMPDVTKYLQRMSYLLRQGTPANDVAVYLPTDDAWAGFTTGHASVDRDMEKLLGPDLIPAILDAGYNFDFIDDKAIEKVGVPYPVVVMPKTKRLSLQNRILFEKYKSKGGVVVDISKIEDLPKLYAPDFVTGVPAIGFIHRHLPDAEVYFVANTGNLALHTKAQVRTKGNAEWWDPLTGSVSAAGGSPIALDLEPYESRVLVFRSDTNIAKAAGGRGARKEVADLSADWKVTFDTTHQTADMPRLRSWTDAEATLFYSGQATYERTAKVDKVNGDLFLNFGQGVPVPTPAPGAPGMRALLESPVREGAVVYVNGQRAGSVWRPPYEVNVTKLVHPGDNQIRVVVGNLAINALAGQALPDYKLLNIRYGERFTPQDMNNLRPLPSGLFGPITLVVQ